MYKVYSANILAAESETHREIWLCPSVCEERGEISAEKVKVMEQVRRG